MAITPSSRTDPYILIVDAKPSGKALNKNATGVKLWENGSLHKIEIQNIFTKKSGNLAIPVAAADDDEDAEPIIAKVHKAIYYKTVLFDIQRLGAPPVVPDWETEDTNLVELESDLVVYTPVDHDGRLFRHQVSGHYKYVFKQPPEKANNDYKSLWCIYYDRAASHMDVENFRREYQEWVVDEVQLSDKKSQPPKRPNGL